MHKQTSSGTGRDHSSPGEDIRAGPHRIPGWRSRSKVKITVAAAVIAGGSAIGLTLFSGAGPAGAATRPAWAMTAGNVQQLSKQDAATAAHFFNTPTSYGAGASLVKTPVQAGYATTPVLSYTSYARFKSQIQNGSIAYPYHWIMYDPEKWSATPVNEQQNPTKYMRLFGQLAHANGLRVIMAPALDLGAVTSSALPRLPRENVNQWYVRVNIAAAAAAAGDIYILQNESNTTNLSMYDAMFNSVSAQARTSNSSISVYSEVSTVNGTRAQMAAAAKSVSADGYYVAAPGAIPEARQFFQTMQNAGY